MIKAMKLFAYHMPSLSVGLTFMTLSLLFGSWLARIPEVQTALALSEGRLGIALLGLPFGALTVMPFATWLSNRFGSNAMSMSTILFCLAAPLPALADGFWSLMGGLFLVGLTNSFMNISMNAAAANVERAYKISIMSSCHGMFSLGAMIGAGSAGLIASMGVPLHFHLLGVAIIMISIQLLLRPTTSQIPREKSESSAFALPPVALWGLAFIGFCIMIGEGAIADWSAIYLSKSLHANPFIASLGYAGFSLTMAIGRFSGDRITLTLGRQKIITIGSLTGTVGLLIAIVSTYQSIAVIGFTLVGLGFSIVVPLLFSAAANTPGIHASAGIAAIASAGIVGFLIAPPVIGMISEYVGMKAGLGFVAILAFIAAGVSWRREEGGGG